MNLSKYILDNLSRFSLALAVLALCISIGSLYNLNRTIDNLEEAYNIRAIARCDLDSSPEHHIRSKDGVSGVYRLAGKHIQRRRDQQVRLIINLWAQDYTFEEAITDEAKQDLLNRIRISKVQLDFLKWELP